VGARHRFLVPGARVVDLGCAPGGWLQVAVKRINALGERTSKDVGFILGIDLQEVEPVAGAVIHQLDFMEDDADKKVTEWLDGKADVVMSDMAASASGHKQTDHLRLSMSWSRAVRLWQRFWRVAPRVRCRSCSNLDSRRLQTSSRRLAAQTVLKNLSSRRGSKARSPFGKRFAVKGFDTWQQILTSLSSVAEFSLVRKALIEREVLLSAMPHISWPMRFVLPYHRDMRFEGDTPTSKLLTLFMPWMKGRRPAWLIRFGLFLYDNLGGRKILPGTKTLDLAGTPEGAPIEGRFTRAYEYSDCWIEDSRLVVLNARDAQDRGAVILTQTKVTSAERRDGVWHIAMVGPDGEKTVTARALVNAGGPWVENIVRNTVRLNSTEGVRLVRGSHIVTKRLFEHDKAYFFQGEDGRITFAIPYETDFTLIGTTDAEHDDLGEKPVATEEEQDYLLAFVNQYFLQDISRDDIVWTYSGVRPLYDDGAKSATAATRDYVLSLNTDGAPLLSVFGGKITTYRKLAENVMAKLQPLIGGGEKWTAGAPLPGGDFAVGDVGGQGDFAVGDVGGQISTLQEKALTLVQL